MPQMREIRDALQNGNSIDETDKMPENIKIKNLDLFMYVVAIAGHFVDLAVDINVAVQYFLADRHVEFGWTLLFILLPAFVNTAVSVRMYSQDKEQEESIANEFTKQHWLRVFILFLQIAPIMRHVDAFIYAIKSRQAERRQDKASQRMYYRLMLKEDSDAALLKVFECFLEAAPQQTLQTSLLLRGEEKFTMHQSLSIGSSIVGMGWCLAAYQRAIRFSQRDKMNVTWCGSLVQVAWHFLITLSRIMSLAVVAYLFPNWLVIAACVHILCMTVWLELFDRSPFCNQSKLSEIAFSLALGGVYLFTYILPIEGRTRYRYTFYYTLCLLENLACALIWHCYVDEPLRRSLYFAPVLALCVVPYILGLMFLVIYYMFLHPKARQGKVHMETAEVAGVEARMVNVELIS